MKTIHLSQKRNFYVCTSNQKRFYTIMDRYRFLHAEKRKREDEEKRKAQAEADKQKALIKEYAEQRRISIDNTRRVRSLPREVKEAGESVRMFQYRPPVQPVDPHSLTVSIIGAPNAGKSSLVNRFVGIKISAVTSKSHTTRTSVLGLATIDNTQLCFVDSPGIISAFRGGNSSRRLGRYAWDSAFESDLIVLIADAVKTITGDMDLAYILRSLEERKKEFMEKNFTLVLNKIDLVNKIDENIRKNPKERFFMHFPQAADLFSRVFEISALDGTNVNNLLDFLVSMAVPREWQFDSKTTSDQSELQIVEEVIREQLFKRLNHEVPYSCHLENIGWTVQNNGTLRIDERILVRKKGHVRMILGQEGRGIYSITEHAQQELEHRFGRPILLFLYPKLDKSREDKNESM